MGDSIARLGGVQQNVWYMHVVDNNPINVPETEVRCNLRYYAMLDAMKWGIGRQKMSIVRHIGIERNLTNSFIPSFVADDVANRRPRPCAKYASCLS